MTSEMVQSIGRQYTMRVKDFFNGLLGEKDEAFRLLDQELAQREAWLPQIRFEPGYGNIRNDPRFKELHRKMGLGHVDVSLPTTTP